jgi:hypothetical protein
MKKLLMLVLGVISVQQFAYADSPAKVQIRISGAGNVNRYFLCATNMGCISILSGSRGKIYPFYSNPEIGALYVTDVGQRYRVMAQPTPSSCRVSVDAGKTLTVYGNLTQVGKNGYVFINQLRCTLS